MSSPSEVTAAGAALFFISCAIALEFCALALQPASILTVGAQHACGLSFTQHGHSVAHGANPLAASTAINRTTKPRRIKAIIGGEGRAYEKLEEQKFSECIRVPQAWSAAADET